LVDRWIRRVRGRLHHQRVAVGLRGEHRLRADDAARARAVLHQHRLPEGVAQVLGDDAAGDVGARARRERDDDADRAGRVLLRERGAGDEQDGRYEEPCSGLHRPSPGRSLYSTMISSTTARMMTTMRSRSLLLSLPPAGSMSTLPTIAWTSLSE